MTDNLARELLDGMSPHERLVQWLEEELAAPSTPRRPTTPRSAAPMAIQECRRGWLREKMT